MRKRFLAALLVMLAACPAEPSGVVAVAGPIGFNPDVVGKPITWANASLTYYTDLGDLSPALPQDSANAFVADAFARWTAAPGTSLTVTRGGALAQDVSGGNVFQSGGQLVMPNDILPSATHRPLGVIYDSDGQVIEALLGSGAGSPSFCETNSVIGGADAYTADAHFAHALLVVNGNCAQQASDLPTLKYRLVRMTGRILGVGWTLLNDNVRTGSPAPTSEDLAGFPVMHPRGPNCQGPITTCLANADQLRMDDRAAIVALYPAAGPAATARIRGIVYFADERGQPGQPMQGVNVVARRIDPASGTPSKIFASASVSGYRFRGDHGNPVTGFLAPGGEPLARFGSADLSLQGFFDLPGLEIPGGQSSASYQLTLEPLNPLYKNEFAVGPARYGVVSPSGSVASVVVQVSAGAEVTRNIVVANSARVRRDAAEPNSFASPSPVPAGGSWWATLGPHGDSDFHHFRVRAGRTFHLRVTALDEAQVSTALKAQPVIGLWPREAPPNSAPLLFAAPFNTAIQGQTRLSVSTAADAELMFGIADLRGDGRSDFLYHARLLYADAVSPGRLPANTGGLLMVNGYGFNGNTTVSIGGQSAPAVARSGSRLVVQAPALGHGAVNVVVTDLGTGDASTISGGLQYGVIGGDVLQVVSAANPAVPVGSETPNPIRMRVTAMGGSPPIAKASVSFVVTPPQSFFPICGANACTAQTDANGEVMVRLAVRAEGEHTVTASIANGAQALATIVGSVPSLAIHASRPSVRVPQGATMPVPVSVRVLANGSPVAGQVVNFSFGTAPTSGTAALSAPSVLTNGQGDALNQVNVSALGSSFTLLACVAGGTPCTTVNVLAVAPASRQMQLVQGGTQLILAGQTPTPIILRVTDTTDTTRPIRGTTVTAATSIFARGRDSDCNLQNTDCHPVSSRPIATAFVTLTTDENGLVAYTPLIQPAWGAVDVYSLFSVGAGANQSVQTSIQVFK